MPGKEIFLSYAREDLERAKALVAAFQRQDWSVWWDRKIPTGNPFALVIEEAIEAAKCAIVLWTEHSVKSQWVMNEANECMERGILLPVLMDDVRVPIQFRHLQTASLVTWRGEPDSRELARLLSDIAVRLGDDPLDQSYSSVSWPRQRGTAPGAKKRRSYRLAGAAAAVGAITLAVFLTDMVQEWQGGGRSQAATTSTAPPADETTTTTALDAASGVPSTPRASTSVRPSMSPPTSSISTTTSVDAASSVPSMPRASSSIRPSTSILSTTSVDTAAARAEEYFAQGVSYRNQGLQEQALESFQQAAALEPKEARHQNAVGATLHGVGRFAEAVTVYETVIRLDPSHALAHGGLASTFHKLGRLEEAAISYMRAIELKPDEVRFHTGLGSVLHDHGKLDQAKTAFLNAVIVEPSYSPAHNGLGAANYDNGYYEEAALSFQKAIALNPRDARAHYNLGVTLKKLGRLAEGDEQIQQARELGYSPSRR